MVWRLGCSVPPGQDGGTNVMRMGCALPRKTLWYLHDSHRDGSAITTGLWEPWPWDHTDFCFSFSLLTLSFSEPFSSFLVDFSALSTGDKGVKEKLLQECCCWVHHRLEDGRFLLSFLVQSPGTISSMNHILGPILWILQDPGFLSGSFSLWNSFWYRLLGGLLFRNFCLLLTSNSFFFENWHQKMRMLSQPLEDQTWRMTAFPLCAAHCLIMHLQTGCGPETRDALELWQPCLWVSSAELTACAPIPGS